MWLSTNEQNTGPVICRPSESAANRTTMRDALNLSFLPMVQDEMDGLSARSCVKGYAPNVSNGYYGYQPVVARRKDEERTHEPEQMDVSEAVHCENSEACPRETRSHNGRKRAWHSEDAANFKRRRENG